MCAYRNLETNGVSKTLRIFLSIHSTDVEAFIYIDTHTLNHIKSDTQLYTYEHLRETEPVDPRE